MKRFWILIGVLVLILAFPSRLMVMSYETTEADGQEETADQGPKEDFLKELSFSQEETNIQGGRVAGLLSYGSDSQFPTIFVHVRSLDGTVVREGISRYNPEEFEPYGFGYEIANIPPGKYEVFAATRLENGQVMRAVYNRCSIWELEMAKWASETREIVDALPIELHEFFERKAPTYLSEKFPCSREDSVPLTIEVRAGETTHDVSPIDWYWNGEYPELPIPPPLVPPKNHQIQYLVAFLCS